MKNKSQIFHVDKLANGITLVGEELTTASSAAFSILVPFGAAYDPAGKDGAATLLIEMLHKGTENWDAKEISNKFEELGVQKGYSPGVEASSFFGASLSDSLIQALKIYSEVILRPSFNANELENVRSLSINELKSLEEEPASKVMVELSKVHFPFPFGRSPLGTFDGVAAVNLDLLKTYYKKDVVPDQTIISVAGRFNWQELKSAVTQYFSSWQGTKSKLLDPEPVKKSSNSHINFDSKQLQIALAYPSVSVDHPDYYVARVIVNILSGGMAGRLFIEVREKLGLVYRVSASHYSARKRAAIIIYAGTTPENSKQTLEVILGELNKLKNGVSDDELSRAKIDLKSRLIMGSELTTSRAGALASDWWNIKRLRTLEEIKSGIDAVTNHDIVRHIEEFPPKTVTLVTLGSKQLELVP